MPRFPRWQWDSAHHGPVFPGCHSKGSYGVSGIWAFREGLRPQPGTTPGFTFWAGMTLPAGGD